MKPQWKIKVLSGTHQGAEIQLIEGEFQLGSDINTADLVFQDSGIPAILGQLIVSAEAIHYRSADQDLETLVDGHLVTQMPVSLISHQRLKTGELLFVVAKIDELWQLDLDTDVTKIDSTAEESLSAQREDNYQDTQSQPKQTKIKRNRLQKNKKKQNINTRHPRWLALLSSVAGTILLVWFISLAGPQPVDSSVQDVKPLSPLQLSEQIVKRLKLANLTLKWQESRQRLVVKGYVPDNESKQQLKAELSAASVPYIIRLYVESDINRSVQFILDNNGLGHINVTSGLNAGEVRLVGLLDNGKRWAKVEKMLKHDVSGLKGYQVDFDSSRHHIATLTKTLEAKNLLGQLQLVSVGTHIEIRGQITKPLEKQLNELVKQFENTINQPGLIKVRNMPLFADNPLYLPVKSISMGSVPYIVLKNNQKYMEGARLPNGYRLAKIDTEFIKLRNQDQIIKVAIKAESYAN